jgi:sortase A
VSSPREADALSLEELEELVQQRRSQATAARIRQVAGIEQTLAPGRQPPEETLAHPPRAPYDAVTPGQPASRLRSLRYEPLRPTPKANAAARRRQQAICRALEDAPVTRQRRRDSALLAVELSALIVLLAMVGYGAWRLRTLNEEARLAQQARLGTVAAMAAEPVPTPSVASASAPLDNAASANAVLPGGREAQPYPQPLPASLQGLVKSSVSLQAPPTPGPNDPRRMVIAALGIDAPVVTGDSWEDLKRGIGYRLGTAKPGERGNMVASAHNDIYGEIFRDLVKLQPGDEVRVYTDETAFRYVVNKVEIVEPTRVEVMGPTDYPILTLITCYPYLLDTHRVVVVADLAE